MRRKGGGQRFLLCRSAAIGDNLLDYLLGEGLTPVLRPLIGFLMREYDGEFSPPFEIIEPLQVGAPVIFNSPHSGSVYPQAFLQASRIDLASLRRSEDSFMDELIAPLAARFPVMRVHFPRSYVDVNREPYELDPRMFTGRLPNYANTRSMRVAGGLGTVPRVVGDGQEIYRDKIPIMDALARIEALYKPYHRALRKLIASTQRSFGTVILMDCHSMPSVGVTRDEARRPDIVIGDRYGSSCIPLLVELVENTLRGLGYSVGRNKPYAGGYITEHYGNPMAGVHAVQIELNRAIYMDERKRERSARFQRVIADFRTLADALGALPWRDLSSFPAAAE